MLVLEQALRKLVEMKCMGNIGVMLKMSDFLDSFLNIWSPDMTPLTTPDTRKRIYVALGHFIVYVTIRNLNLCKSTWVNQ